MRRLRPHLPSSRNAGRFPSWTGAFQGHACRPCSSSTGRGCGDQGCVDDHSFSHHQTSLRPVGVDRLEDLTRQFARFEQVTEFGLGRRIRRALAI